MTVLKVSSMKSIIYTTGRYNICLMESFYGLVDMIPEVYEIDVIAEELLPQIERISDRIWL